MRLLSPAFVSFCPCLFTYWVEWETKVGMLACVCSHFGSSGKQKQEYLPVFVYVLGGFGNKRGELICGGT